jgi:hypothetical protein
MSSSFLSEFVAKTLARFSANKIDVSLVEKSQILPDFLRGGMGTIGVHFFFPSILNGRLWKVL